MNFLCGYRNTENVTVNNAQLTNWLGVVTRPSFVRPNL